MRLIFLLQVFQVSYHLKSIIYLYPINKITKNKFKKSKLNLIRLITILTILLRTSNF